MKISLLVADDHPVIRQGVGSLLKGSEVQVLAEAARGN
jgi:DNA-binding NarL/FixJ family response regulator